MCNRGTQAAKFQSYQHTGKLGGVSSIHQVDAKKEIRKKCVHVSMGAYVIDAYSFLH